MKVATVTIHIIETSTGKLCKSLSIYHFQCEWAVAPSKYEGYLRPCLNYVNVMFVKLADQRSSLRTSFCDGYAILMYVSYFCCRRKWRAWKHRVANERRGGEDWREGGGNHRGTSTRNGHPNVGPSVHHNRGRPDHPRHLWLLHPALLPQETLQRWQEGHERSRSEIGTIIRFSIQRKGIQ